MADASIFRSDGNGVDLDRESRELSSRLVKHLLRSGHTAQGLAEALGLGKSFISRVKSGERSFRLEHLQQIERLTATPLPLLLLQIHDQLSVTDSLRKSYDLMHEFLQRSRQLRKLIERDATT